MLKSLLTTVNTAEMASRCAPQSSVEFHINKGAAVAVHRRWKDQADPASRAMERSRSSGDS